MLTPRDEQPFVTSVLAARLAVVDVRLFARTTLAPDDMEFLRDLPNNLTLPDQHAEFLIGHCLDSRWTHTPSLLERVLTALITAGLEVPRLVPIRDRVRQGIDPNPSPIDARWLDANLPFFSRVDLRRHVEDLLITDAQPILQIAGPAQGGEECGKSYTREFLDYVSSRVRRDVHVIFAEIPKGTGPSYAVEELAEVLVAPTGKDISLRPMRAASNYPRALCRWVLNAAIGTPGKWIYVLDGFNQPDVQTETRALVQALAVDIAGGEFRRRIRLVLIDYPSALPSVQPAKILREDVPAAMAVGEDDIVACLNAHYVDLAQRKPQRPPSDADLRIVAKSLLESAPPGPAKRLEVLNSTLRKLRQDDLR
jgi:hypothetical protein